MGASAVPLAEMVSAPYWPSASTRQSPGLAPEIAPPSAPLPDTGTMRLHGGSGGSSETGGGGGGVLPSRPGAPASGVVAPPVPPDPPAEPPEPEPPPLPEL